MKTLGLSARAAALRPSPTLAITAKANSLRAEGKDVISFAAGEPDFNTPDSICEAAIDAIHKGFTKYTPSAGTKDLKDAIVSKLATENGLTVAPDQVVVSCGAKHSLYNVMQTLVEPGDEVILLAPYWMTYAEQVKLAEGVPVVIHCAAEAGFVPTFDQLKAAISPRTKMLVLNSPSNPTGAVLPRETLKEIAALALRHGFWVVSDEIYERLVYGVTPQCFASLGKEIAEQTITIGGVSKTYAMTGWRIGFAAGPKWVAAGMSHLQDQVTSNPTSFAQVGAAAAFRMPASSVETMRAEFEARRDIILAGLRAIPDVKVPTPEGAFYAFPDFSAYLSPEIPDDLALATYLLDEAEVAVIPGSVFEGPGHLRLSYAASRDNIQRGLERIEKAVSKLRA